MVIWSSEDSKNENQTTNQTLYHRLYHRYRCILCHHDVIVVVFHFVNFFWFCLNSSLRFNVNALFGSGIIIRILEIEKKAHLGFHQYLLTESSKWLTIWLLIPFEEHLTIVKNVSRGWLLLFSFPFFSFIVITWVLWSK